MTFTRRTNYFVLFLFLNQYLWRVLWPYIIPALGLGANGQGILSQLLLFVLPALIYFAMTKESVKTTLALKPLNLQTVILIILIAFAIQPFMSVLAAISSIFFPNNVSNALYTLHSEGFLLMFLSMAITPAICEELFFRGIVFSGYRLQSLGRACLFTGLLFGLMHMDGQQFLYAFAMGTLFCFLRYRTKSLFAPMLAHFTINGTQVVLSWLAYSAPTTTLDGYILNDVAFGMFTILIAIIVLVVSFATLGAAFWLLLKVNPENLEPEDGIVAYYPPANWKEEFVDVPFFIIVSIYVVDVVIYPIISGWL